MTTILFLGGPAGVGKSTFASTFLNTQGWGHIEFDGYSGGGVDASLRPSWNAYYDHSRPVQLWKELCRQHSASENVVVTVPGTCTFYARHLSAAEGLFHIAYLYGSRDLCLSAFLERERETGAIWTSDIGGGTTTKSIASLNGPLTGIAG